MTRKYANIDGSDSLNDDLDEDDKYVKTLQYWKQGKVGTVYQIFLDVLNVIETSDLSEEDQNIEKAKVMESRKNSFGSDSEHFPLWS